VRLAGAHIGGELSCSGAHHHQSVWPRPTR
jgi:hypothetical protein